MTDQPQWMTEIFSMNMAYRPRSRPNFAGDLQHDVRDSMLEGRAETLAIWTGLAANHYLAAAHLLAIKDDPVADSLEVFPHFDLHSLQVAHDHMAAHWRQRWMPEFLSATYPYVGDTPDYPRCHYRRSIAGCLYGFRLWLQLTTDKDARHHPVVIRRLCLVLVQQNTTTGYLAEMDLFETLRARYPVT